MMRVMEDRIPDLPDVEGELTRIGNLPAPERPSALEELERRLRAALDDIPTA